MNVSVTAGKQDVEYEKTNIVYDTLREPSKSIVVSIGSLAAE
jgi:hypothetical protein